MYCLEIRVVKFEPLDGPGSAAGGARSILCVLGLLLAEARSVLLDSAQHMCPYQEQEEQCDHGMRVRTWPDHCLGFM